jgi:hypothetical protein
MAAPHDARHRRERRNRPARARPRLKNASLAASSAEQLTDSVGFLPGSGTGAGARLTASNTPDSIPHTAKRKRALLGSNPPRNSRWKLTAMRAGMLEHAGTSSLCPLDVVNRGRFPNPLQIQFSALQAMQAPR